MNKKLLALAVAAGMSAPVVALADASTITMTGVINGSLEWSKFKDNSNGRLDARCATAAAPGSCGTKGQSQRGIASNATRWQIDGVEDVGGGLRAIFSLAIDQHFAGLGPAGDPLSPQNSSNLFNRNSYIGLAGNWGALKWGQTEHAFELQQILQDPFPASENRGNALTTMTRFGNEFIGGGTGGFTRRDPQSIWYTSPTLYGFVLDAAYITGAESKTNINNPYGWQVAGRFTWEWLNIYAAYADYHDDIVNFPGIAGTTAGQGSDTTAWRVGAGIVYGDFTLDGAYNELKAKDIGKHFPTGFASGSTSDDLKRDEWYVAASYRIGPASLKGAFTQALKEKGSLCSESLATISNPLTGTPFIFTNGNCDQTKSTLWIVGVWYDLSNRSSVYIDYYDVKNHEDSSFLTGTNGLSQNGVSVGLRHRF